MECNIWNNDKKSITMKQLTDVLNHLFIELANIHSLVSQKHSE